MIYLDNKTNTQECWIPRNDGLGAVHKSSYQEGYEDGFASGETHQKNLLSSITFTENGEYARENGWSAVTVDVPQTGSTATLEEKSVSISADTTVVLPSSGFDGMSAVTIDASEYAQSNYEGGFEDGYQDGFMSGSSEGFESGYTSGHSQGMADQKELLVSTAFTENGSYSRENGWSGVTVNVDTASTWNSGYTSGHTDGVSEEKAKMSAVTFTANTAVTLSDGSYSAVTVDVPQTGYTQQDLDNAFASGETVGENTIIATFSSTTATTNGQYGSSAHPLSAITVNVPQTGSSINVEANRYVSTAHSGTLVIHPSSGYSTSVSGTFETGDSRFNTAIRAYNYPSIGTFELVKVVDESDHSKGETVFNLTNGSIVVDDTNWSGTPFHPFIQEGPYMTGWFYDANEHYKVVEGADYYYAPFDVMSAVTVDINVPEYNVEPDKPFTATSNGTYVINATSASTTVTDRFDSDVNRYYITATTSGFPLTGRYNLFYIEDEFDSSKGQIDVYIENGYLDYDDSDWYGGEIVDLSVSRNIDLFIRNANRDFGWTPLEDFSHNFDVMSAVSLNVNVQLTNNYENKAATASTNGTMVITPSTIWSVPYTFVTEYYVRYARFVIEGVGPQNYTNPLYRIDWSGYEGYGFLLVKFNANGDELVIDDSNFNTSAYPYTFEYNENEDSYDFVMRNFQTPTPLSTGSTYDAMSAVTLTVNVPQSSAVFREKTITLNGTYSASTDNCDGYSAITINVSGSSSGPKFIKYIGINNPSRNTCYFELGNTGTGLDSKIVIEHSTLSKENTGSDWESWLMFCDADRGRIFVEDGTAPIQFDGRYNKNSLPYTAITDETIVLEYSGVTVGNSSFNMQYNPYEVSNCNNMVVFAAYGSEFFTYPSNQLKYGKIGTISIYDSANTLTYQYKPCLDENNVICFYEEVNDVYVYPNNGGDTYLYSGPVIDEMYESGYTDGIAYQKSLLGEFTATTNGSFSAENGYSAITVNVPQETITLVDYISAAQLQDNSDYRDGIELGNIWTTDTEFRIKGWMTGNYTGQGVLSNYDGEWFVATRWFWIGNNMYYDFNNDRIDTGFTPTSGTAFDYTINNWGVYDNLTSSYVMSGSPKQSINAGVVWLNMCTCRISSIEVKQGNNVILNGLAAFDSGNHIGLYDTVSEQMFYNSGLSMTYGNVLGTIDYLSGYTDGFASGSSQGYIGGIESSLFGAYYPIDSATNKSYCTHFPDLEEGKSIYFDIISTSSRVANKMFGGDYMNRDEHYLMIGYDNSNNEIDIQINAKGTPSGITTNAYLTLFNPTSGSIIYNPNQRICGEIAVTDTECNYGVACLGFVPNKYTVQGDFTGSYPIKFNQDCASAFTLCKVVYRDIATGAFEHYFSYDSSTNEIKDWITGDIAPTYDYNGNRAYGVLETKEL